MPGPTTVTLAGKVFAIVEHATFEQDLWVMQHVRKARLLTIAVKDADDIDAMAEEVIFRAFESGRLFLIVSGLLQEGQEPFDAEKAVTRAKWLSQLTAEEDKAELRNVMVGALFRFFLHGVVSKRTSERLLQRAQADAAPDALAGSSDLANGKTSSADSPVTITTPTIES